MNLVVACADEGVAESRSSIPTEPVIEAIARVTPVWDD
jgi:hypothetical protein